MAPTSAALGRAPALNKFAEREAQTPRSWSPAMKTIGTARRNSRRCILPAEYHTTPTPVLPRMLSRRARHHGGGAAGQACSQVLAPTMSSISNEQAGPASVVPDPQHTRKGPSLPGEIRQVSPISAQSTKVRHSSTTSFQGAAAEVAAGPTPPAFCLGL